MKSKRVEFTLPQEFQLPEGLTPGEEFDSVCTFRLKNGGDVCLVMLGDTAMPGYDSKDNGDQARPDYKQAAQNMMAGGQSDNNGNET